MIEMLPIAKLKLSPDNPRTISREQLDKLCKSMEDDPEFLNCRPVLVNRSSKYTALDPPCPVDRDTVKRIDTYTVYAGNMRVRAARKLKLKQIPCIVSNDLSEEHMRRRMILDNKQM